MEGGSTIISIAFMFSPIYLRLEDNVPPPPQKLKLDQTINAIEKKIISSEVSKCILQSSPPFLPSSTLSYFMPEQETCEFQFQMDI